jgi:hypothetical protein
MPIPDNSCQYRRTSLFVLRVWCDDPEPDENENSVMDAKIGPKWHGRVQRTVSGEAHNFEGKEDLIEVLERMLCKVRREPNGLPGKTSSDAGTPRGNDSIRAKEAKKGTG